VSKEMESAHTEYWLNKKDWRINELVFLLRDLEPVPLNELDKGMQIIIEASAQGLVSLINEDAPFPLSVVSDPKKQKVSSSSLLQWVSNVSSVKILAKWKPLLPFSDLEKQTRTTDNGTLSAKARKTYLLIIAALLCNTKPERHTEIKKHISNPYYEESNGALAQLLSEIGANVCQNTIAKVLRELNDIMEDLHIK